MRVAVIVQAVALAACGRIAFDTAYDGDAATDRDAAMACPSFAIVCDDFETGNLSRWSRSFISTSSTLLVQDQLAYAGRFALDADVAPQPGTGDITAVVHDQPVQTTGVLAARAWAYAPIQLEAYEGVLQFVIDNTFDQYVLAACSAGLWRLSEGSPAGGQRNYASTASCTATTWQCVELVYTLAPPRAQLFVDDVQVVDVTPVDPAPAFGFVAIGAARADMDGTRVIVDEAIVANQRIGCSDGRD